MFRFLVISFFFFLSNLLPPISTLTNTLFPYTTLFRSKASDADNPNGADLYALNGAGGDAPGPGHPATMLLEEMERPVAPLIGRKDLDKDYVHSVVRNGLIEMPPFRPTELTDADVDLVFTYIKTAKGPSNAP